MSELILYQRKPWQDFEILEPKKLNDHHYVVLNYSHNTDYDVVRSRHLDDNWTCSCPFGTQEISAEKISEGRRCKHVEVVENE